VKDLLRLALLVLARWRWVLLGVALSLLTLLANVGLLALSSWFIAAMAIAGSTGIVVAYALPAAGVRALALARAAGRYAERLVNHETTLRILSDLKAWFYEGLVPLAPAALSRHRAGDLLSRIRADVDALDDFYVRGVVPSAVALLAAAGSAAFLLRFDARLAAIDLAALAACGVVLPAFLQRLAVRPGARRVACAADLRASIVEGVQGMAELTALGAADHHDGLLAAAGRDLDGAQRRLASLQGVGDAGIVAAGSLAAWAAALLLAGAVERGLAPAAMAMLTVFVLATFETIMPLPSVIQRSGETAAAARRLFEIIDREPAVAEPRGGGEAPCGVAPAAGLEIRDLWFRYAPDLPWVLRGLSLDAPAASRLAVVGPTGAGKSSLVGVLLRFWDYQRGSIRIAGRELRSLLSDDARGHFSVAPQTPWLFHASIRDNLLIAAAAPDEELWSALETAQLADFARGLPEGLATLVGERGAEMSAGQVRRIAVARALLRSAPICILDEPTEGLDDEAADRLLAAVERRLRGRTLVVISHRDRDLAVAGRVVRLDQ
jgi:ATP-binding cassette subfamily C protein CydC